MGYDFLEIANQIENDLKNECIEKEKGMIVYEGNIPILLSAPHSVEQTREGKTKYGEGRTASIVKLIHEQKKCYGAFKTINFNDDANYDEKNYYKDTLIDLIRKNDIKLLLDLHIMAPNRMHNIDIGTGRGQNILGRTDLLEMIKDNFKANAITAVEVDYMFMASFRNTVSATISRECKIPCFQFEMNWKLLDDHSEYNKLENIINAMGQCIEDLKRKL